MQESSRGRVKRKLRSDLVYIGFAVLFLLATAPAWRLFVFGLTIDDLLQLRCF